MRATKAKSMRRAALFMAAETAAIRRDIRMRLPLHMKVLFFLRRRYRLMRGWSPEPTVMEMARVFYRGMKRGRV